MFTIEQIKTAHSKVKSGSDFPKYIKEIKALGIKHYEAYVSDGHVIYYGTNDHTVKAPAKYEAMIVVNACNEKQFKSDLKAHQNGKTDYPTFCNDAAKSGIEKWIVSMKEMTCTYFDISGNIVLVEEIPQ